MEILEYVHKAISGCIKFLSLITDIDFYKS